MSTPIPPPGSNDPYAERPQDWGPQLYQRQPLYGQPTYGTEWAPLAEWLPRVGASLIDSLVQSVPFIVGYVAFIANVFSRSELENNAPSLWAVLVFLAGMAISFGLWLWNRVFRQGRTGQSVGKSVLKIRLIDGASNQPVGAAKSLGRELLSMVFGYVPLLDSLWPLWDDKKQTLHDKVLNTYVVSVGQQERGAGY
jgi:uncharacterized RDD family membrane protein YckC